MVKLLFKIHILVMFILVFSPARLFANGPATVYKVTISKFELNNGTGWITVFQGTSATLDIAAVSSGAAAGNFFSGLAVPDGAYTQVRVTPSSVFTIKGNDGANYTTATIGSNGGCTPGAQAAQAECTVTAPSTPSPQTQDFSATPITVKEGIANRKVRVSFDVSSSIQTQGGELFPAEPTVTLSVQ